MIRHIFACSHCYAFAFKQWSRFPLIVLNLYHKYMHKENIGFMGKNCWIKSPWRILSLFSRLLCPFSKIYKTSFFRIEYKNKHIHLRAVQSYRSPSKPYVLVSNQYLGETKPITLKKSTKSWDHKNDRWRVNRKTFRFVFKSKNLPFLPSHTLRINLFHALMRPTLFLLS